MAGPTQTRQLGSACRIYKNDDEMILAVDDISIVVDTRKVGDGRWHHSGTKQYSRCLFHLEVGNRVIDHIQMMGNYTSITEDSGDYLIATWADSTGNANDVEISFGDLGKLGDSV